MIRLILSLACVASLAACDDAAFSELGTSLGLPGAEPPPPPQLPVEVVRALPPGAPQSTVLLNGDGCYIFTVELTDPPSGYPVRDASGTPLCESNTSEPPPPPAPVIAEAAPADGAGNL